MSSVDNSAQVQDGKLFIEGTEIATEYPVSEAFQDGEKIIVLFDPDSRTEKFGQFPNLIAMDVEGNNIWAAELPTTSSGDQYYQISSRRPLVADSIYSYNCELDVMTGKITEKTFYK